MSPPPWPWSWPAVCARTPARGTAARASCTRPWRSWTPPTASSRRTVRTSVVQNPDRGQFSDRPARAADATLGGMSTRALIIALGLAALTACGGGGSSPAAPTGSQTETFTGTSSVNAAGTCTGAIRHLFAAGEGTVVVALAQVSGATSVVVQVCPQNKVGDSLCSVQPWARLAANETV